MKLLHGFWWVFLFYSFFFLQVAEKVLYVFSINKETQYFHIPCALRNGRCGKLLCSSEVNVWMPTSRTTRLLRIPAAPLPVLLPADAHLGGSQW